MALKPYEKFRFLLCQYLICVFNIPIHCGAFPGTLKSLKSESYFRRFSFFSAFPEQQPQLTHSAIAGGPAYVRWRPCRRGRSFGCRWPCRPTGPRSGGPAWCDTQSLRRSRLHRRRRASSATSCPLRPSAGQRAWSPFRRRRLRQTQSSVSSAAEDGLSDHRIQSVRSQNPVCQITDSLSQA